MVNNTTKIEKNGLHIESQSHIPIENRFLKPMPMCLGQYWMETFSF